MEEEFPPRRSSAPISNQNSGTSNDSVESDSDMNNLRNGMSLPLSSQMAIPIYTAPTREDVEIGGRLLFQNFIHEELEREHLPDIEVDNPPLEAFGDGDVRDSNYSASFSPRRPDSPALVSIPEGFNNSHFSNIGANIRDIADQFGHSHERQLIREQAERFELNGINYATFRHMLSALFKNGIDKYRIVALFYFCSDVVIRCMRSELHKLGSRLFFWALEFLFQNICKWVYEHGGWEKVFSNIYNVAMKVSAIVALGVFIACGIIYVRKNL